MSCHIVEMEFTESIFTAPGESRQDGAMGARNGEFPGGKSHRKGMRDTSKTHFKF